MATEDIRLRLKPNVYDPATQSIYVDVEILYDGSGEFALADQNYRLYFDATTMSLVEHQSNSDLPSDQYSPIQFHQVIEHADAGGVNQLSFDNDLGFINFSIDLINDSKGGLTIKRKHGWERVAVLSFKLSEGDPSQLVWGREEATDEYATAFVEIMEWKGPNWSEPADIILYEDTSVDMHDVADGNLAFTMSPNPSIDFIRVDFEHSIKKSQINIYGVNGSSVYDLELLNGTQFVKIPTSDLSAGTYTLEVKDKKTGFVHIQSFIKVKK